MSCPICDRMLCDHSPAERGQTPGEMMADLYAGAPSPTPRQRPTRSVAPPEELARARAIIELDGGDGYRTAANIVGPEEADKLLADLVARNMGIASDDERVRSVVAEVRKQKGF